MASDPPSTEVPGTTLERPVFLVGSERSGTTLLRLMLDHHPEIAFNHESDYLVGALGDDGREPTLSEFHSYLDTQRMGGMQTDHSLDYGPLVRSFLIQKWEASGRKPILGATVHHHFDRLIHTWPQARFIFLHRDPRDVARSIVQKGWAGNVYEGARWWREAERCHDVLCTRLPEDRILRIGYEALVGDPEGELARICQFIGVGYDPEMLEYQRNAPQYPKPDARLAYQWKRKMTPREVALVEAQVGDLLTRRGYERSDHPPMEVGRMQQRLLEVDSRVRRLRQSIRTYGLPLVAFNAMSKRLRFEPLAREAKRRMNARVDALVAEESAGKRAPSANIPVAGAGGGKG